MLQPEFFNNEDPKIIDSRWVLMIMKGQNSEKLHKARLVTKGFKDRNEYGLDEICAPVARMQVIRALIVIIHKFNLEVRQLDVNTAFLNGILEKVIYMKIPEGLNCNEEVKKTKVYKLKRAIKFDTN